MRLAVLRLAEKSWRVVWSFHHLLLDGWSVGRVLNEVLALYDAPPGKEPLRLDEPPLFRDYIAWLVEQGTAKARGLLARGPGRLHRAHATARRGSEARPGARLRRWGSASSSFPRR